MRLGERGAERPVVRIDDATYVDVSDLTPDFGETFFGGPGIAGLRADESAALLAEFFAAKR